MKKFTLIELLVVVAIIGILISILLPSLIKARHTSMRAVCLNNTSQMAKLFFTSTLRNDGYIFRHETDNHSNNPWGFPRTFYKELGEPPRDLFYCPLRHGRNKDSAWNRPGEITTGYIYTWKRQSGIVNDLISHSWVEQITAVNNPANNPLVGDTFIKHNGRFESPAIWSDTIYSSHMPEGFKEMSITYTDGHSKFAKWGSFSHQLSRFGREIWW